MKDFQVNPDLLEERMLCPFDQEELTNLLDGGKQSTEERRRLEKYFLQSGAGKPDVDIDALGAVERYEYDIKKSTELFKIAQDNNDGAMANIKAMVGGGTGAALMPDGTPLGLHFIMFIPTLMGQGTLDQQAEWLGRAWNMEIIGTYAQTELGHGTFIRGLETTATYDERTQEFILHSPTITAYKWWPGGLGKTANHAVVMAQLITKGQKRGPHPFFVQLRDEDTHVPLKGIKIGEIGPKLGMNSNDNGYLGFESHRIPRKHLLMKNAQILVPLSMCVGFVFVGQNLWQAYSHIQQDIEEGNFDKLPELHALSSGLKALVTQECADAMDSLRRACGGHGFMCNSNLPRLWGLVTASCTYEGENTVLQLQVARFVMKCLDQDQSKPLPESMKYLRARDSSSTCTTIRGLVLLFQTTARNMALKAQLALKANEKTASHKAYAWNQTTVQLSLAALATVRAHVVSEFATAVENPSISEPLRNILRDLFELLALAWIQRFSGDFLQYGGAQAVQISWVQERILVLLAQIRPIAVSVVDAFDIPDEALKSTLGSYDGRVYERMLEAAMRGPLNEKDVPDAFHKYLKPMMQSNL
ncbi:hypothetical protein TCAL_02920 [Tigriopus californicus]|uniref:Acyl-coenzyme A oxidase n=1 Tax=Tigriopus californicus TaxID=6832 RepID=A0A553NQU8_TIGCA|nr:hypothetical protein TCAL_02920 [Tigriopus californicus]